MATTSVREFNLVVPLAKATDKRTADTASACWVRSGAVSLGSNPQGDVDSTNGRSTQLIQITPGIRTSTTAIRTTTTRTTSRAPAQSEDHTAGHHADFSFEELVQAYLDCRRTKRAQLANILRKRGYSINTSITKTYRRKSA